MVMTIAKLQYGSSFRKIQVPTTDASFASVVLQTQSIFQLPTNTPVTLIYTDADGDKVFVNSDSELQLAVEETESASRSLKFEVATDASQIDAFEVVNDTSPQDETESIAQAVDAMKVRAESEAPSNMMNVDQETIKETPQTPTQSEHPPQYDHETNSHAESSKRAEKQPEGPASATASMEEESGPSTWEELQDELVKIQEKFQEVIAENPELFTHVQELAMKLWEEKVTFWQRRAGTCGRRNGWCGRGYGRWGRCGGAGSWNCGGNNPWNLQPQLSDEEINSKVNEALAMGFVDEVAIRDLVKRYGGKMERVIEVLLQQQSN